MDAVLLEEVLSHIHNWFERGTMRIDGIDGSEPDGIMEGTWYRIQGSLLNDGLHQSPAEDLVPEEFDGTVTVLAIPRPLLRVVEDIEAWVEANSEAMRSPYTSESFGGYSYSLKSGLSPENGTQGLSGWRLTFRDRLNAWRKLA